MVKLRKDNVIILGFSDENMNRLNRNGKNQPIKFNLSELGFDDIDVVIFNGENEQEMAKMFKDQINPFTTIIKDSNADKN